MSLFSSGEPTPAIALTDILQIEDTADLLAFACPETAIPIWPALRIAFFRLVMGDVLFATDGIESPAPRQTWRAGTNLGRAAAHNAAFALRGALRSDVLINTESVGDELIEGRWFNRYVDPFADLEAGQAVVLMDMFEWQWRTPRHNERIYYHAPVQVGAALVGRLSRSAAAAGLAEAVTALACARAKALLDWDIGEPRRAAFIQWASRKVAALPFRYRAYSRLIARVRPRLLLGSSGCYGAHAPLIAAARDQGVVTAEYQHGAISAGHDAYNFAPAVIESQAYRRTLPQYLLTYGAWWSGQVTAPVECVAVGYPARAAKLERMAAFRPDRRAVLILSDGIEFDLYLDFARTVARAVESRGLDVVLRPHPAERTTVLERYGTSVDGVQIDDGPDIYAAFTNAHTVVSELSTGLFEAVGLVDRIILLNTAKARFAFPTHPFAAANSVDEAIALIDDELAPMVDGAALWEPDWQKNYQWFLRGKVGIAG